MDQLAQAYRWSYQDIIKLTMPQIIMLNHASKVNHKRSEARAKKRQEKDDKDPVVFNGKRASELTIDEMAAYMGDTGNVFLQG